MAMHRGAKAHVQSGLSNTTVPLVTAFKLSTLQPSKRPSRDGQDRLLKRQESNLLIIMITIVTISNSAGVNVNYFA